MSYHLSKNTRQFLLGLPVLLGCLLLCSCSTQRPPRPLLLSSTAESTWSGKINLTIETDPKQSFATEFDLQGAPQEGAMQFYTSLGTTIASAQWNSLGAELVRGNESGSGNTANNSLHFNSLQDLSQRYMGASLPVEMIFEWANGGNPQAPKGWIISQSAAPSDLKEMGELRAIRQQPLPRVELRVWLKRTTD